MNSYGLVWFIMYFFLKLDLFLGNGDFLSGFGMYLDMIYVFVNFELFVF